MMTAATINVPLEASRALALIQGTDTAAGKFFKEMMVKAIEAAVSSALGSAKPEGKP